MSCAPPESVKIPLMIVSRFGALIVEVASESVSELFVKEASELRLSCAPPESVKRLLLILARIGTAIVEVASERDTALLASEVSAGNESTPPFVAVMALSSQYPPEKEARAAKSI